MPTKYYTYKKQAQAACQPGQTVRFTKGKGYYCYPIVAPPPPPPTGVVVAPPQGVLVVQDGGSSKGSYQFLYAPQALAGGDIGGLDIRNFTSYGIGIMSWNPALANAHKWFIHDSKISGISANPPRSENGTGEAGLWVGQFSEVARLVFGPGNAWMDVWTGSMCAGSHLHDLLLQHPEHVGIYHEHKSNDVLVEKFKTLQGSPGQSNPITVEWTYGGEGSHGITWREFEIYCPAGATGIFMDAGTWACIVGDPSPSAPKCIFTGPGDAIGVPNNLAGPTKNVVNMDNIIFKNQGRQVYYHNNGIGIEGEPAQPVHELHPHSTEVIEVST